MHKVEIRLDMGALGEQMGAMRSWLDEHRCEMSAFSCHQDGSRIVVSVPFN
jgi:hypothetical protein